MRKAFVHGFVIGGLETWRAMLLQARLEQGPEYATSFGKKSFNIRIAAPKPKRAGMLKQCATAAEFNPFAVVRSEEHTSELQSLRHLVCRLLLEKKKQKCIYISLRGIQK